MIRAPEGEVGVVSEGHHAGRLGILVHGQFLDGDLRLGRLPLAAVRHQDGGTADGGVEHLHEALLGSHVRRAHDEDHLLFQGLPCRFALERILVLDGQDLGLRIVFRAGAVDERAGEVADLAVPVEHAHPAGIGDIGHVGDLDVVHGAEFHHPLLVGRFHDHGHPLLGLADRELRRVQAGVFRRHAVQPDVQAIGQLADGDAHAAGAEVVRLLDEFRHFRTAEKTLQLAFLRGVTLLDFATAGFERSLGVLLGGTGGAADAVAAGTAAQQEDHVAGRGALATHGGGTDGAHHRADFHALGCVAFGIDFPHVGGGKTDLVAVAGIAGGGLLGDHPLRQLARDGFGHGSIDIAGAGHAHRLIHVGAPGERVADGAAEAGRRSAEGLDLGRMVMGFVLELEEPFLGLTVHIDIHEDAAGVVLLAHVQVVQLALLAQPAGADGRELHQAAGLVPAAEVRPHLLEQREGGFQFGLDEGLVHRDLLQHGGEGGVTAVVAPVGVQDTEFRLGGIPALGLEVLHDLAEVVRVHRQAVALAESEVLVRSQVDEARQVLQGLHIGLLAKRENGQVLLAAFHRVDEIVLDLRERLVRDRVLEDHEAGALDLDLRFRVDQMDAVHGGGGPLVELAGNVFHSDVFLAREREVVGDGVRHHFPEHAVAALLQQVVGEAEKVVHVDEPEGSQAQGEVLVELGEEARGLHAELLLFLYKDAPALHVFKIRCPPAQGGGGGHCIQITVWSTLSLCCWRKSSSFFRRASSPRARMATAYRAAFLAPSMAIVATGMPEGIWTMDRRESRPFRALDFTGTPMTGSVVKAAITPGRWAAPPAPAMMMSKPFSRAART